MYDDVPLAIRRLAEIHERIYYLMLETQENEAESKNEDTKALIAVLTRIADALEAKK